MTDYRVLRIGVASDEEIKTRMFAIARGEITPAETDPKIWVRSLSELHTLLSDENKVLIDAIRKAPGITVGELAEMTGRKQPSVSRSLGRLANLNMVTLNKDGRSVVPEVQFDRFEVAL